MEPRGPLVNSEYYTGWLTHWAEREQTVRADDVVHNLRWMLSRGVNVNFYVFMGGTNFGFTAGANYGKTYDPQLTSYDYDAPLSEAGDPTAKYFAIRDAIAEVETSKTRQSFLHHGISKKKILSFLKNLFIFFYNVTAHG